MEIQTLGEVYGSRHGILQTGSLNTTGSSSPDAAITQANAETGTDRVGSPRTERRVSKYRSGFSKRGNSFRETLVIKENFDFDGKRQLNQYTITEELGKGSYGRVMKAYNRETKDYCAIKIVDKKALTKIRVGRFGNALQSVKKELNLWKKLKHRHIVVLREVIDTEGSKELFMISELLDGGPVLDGESICTPLDTKLAKVYFSQLIEGIDFLHCNRIIHRDIKPGNLLLKKDGDGFILKIADFGVSHEMEDGDDSLRTTAGTAMFSAPEMLTGEKFNGPPIDIWACGITLYMFIYGHPPFQASTLPELYKKIQNDPIEFPAMAHGKCVDKNVIDLLERMLEKDPKKRYTTRYIRVHPWAEREFEVTTQICTQDDEAAKAAADQQSNLSRSLATVISFKTHVKKWFKSRTISPTPGRWEAFSDSKSYGGSNAVALTRPPQSQQSQVAGRNSFSSPRIVPSSEEGLQINIPTSQSYVPVASPSSRMSELVSSTPRTTSAERLDSQKSTSMAAPALTTDTGPTGQLTVETPIILTPKSAVDPVLIRSNTEPSTTSGRSSMVEKIETGIKVIQLVN